MSGGWLLCDVQYMEPAKRETEIDDATQDAHQMHMLHINVPPAPLLCIGCARHVQERCDSQPGAHDSEGKIMFCTSSNLSVRSDPSCRPVQSLRWLTYPKI